MPNKNHNKWAKSPDFFQNNNAIKKRSQAYTISRTKSKKILSNILYIGINREDFYNENFIFDNYTLLVKNLNPFSLDRKLNDHNKHEMIYILSKECMPAEFYKFVCLKKNFLYLNVPYPRVAEIISEFIHENEKYYNKLKNKLAQFKNIFQFIYSTIYPEIYCSTKRRGFGLKNTFQLFFKTYKDKKKLEKMGKHIQSYTLERNESFTFEQKPVEIDTFNDQKEKKIKEKVEKRKRKLPEVAKKTRY